MTDILFAHAYFIRFDPKQWQTGLPYPPLGTLIAAAVLRENGYKVSLYDTMFATGPDEINGPLNKFAPALFVIYDDGFNYLTKMCLTNMREAAFKMCKLARAKGCTVIVSSSDSTDRYEEYLNEGADFILLGEAEASLLELVNQIKNRQTNFEDTAGLAFKKNGQITKTVPRAVLKDLDTLPLPAWDLIAMDTYRGYWMKNKGYFSVNMGTTRGCPYKCNWCAKPIYGNRYNSRSPEHVVAELKLLIENYKVDHIWFCDDIFGLKPGWVQKFAELVEKEQLRFKFKIQSRADLLLNHDQVKALAAAGCENAWIGAESGSQKILDAMDKGITTEQIYGATTALKAHGIKPSFFIQFGYPAETMADIAMTIKMINTLLPHEIGISVSYPLPGTVFYQNVKAQLKEKSNWTDSDEMALMFTNTYPPAFYKQLHRYVHQNYQVHLAKAQVLTLIKNPARAGFQSVKKALSVFYHLPLALISKFKLMRSAKLAI